MCHAHQLASARIHFAALHQSQLACILPAGAAACQPMCTPQYPPKRMRVTCSANALLQWPDCCLPPPPLPPPPNSSHAGRPLKAGAQSWHAQIGDSTCRIGQKPHLYAVGKQLSNRVTWSKPGGGGLTPPVCAPLTKTAARLHAHRWLCPPCAPPTTATLAVKPPGQAPTAVSQCLWSPATNFMALELCCLARRA